MNKHFLALAITVLLASCSTSAPRALDAVLLPEHFTAPVMPQAPLWPNADWWSEFGDPDLSALEMTAQENNRDLSAAAARVLQAEAQYTIQRASLFPQVIGDASYANGNCAGQGCNRFIHDKAFTLDINARYDLDFWGLARSNQRAASEQLKSARYARQLVVLRITAHVANEYFNVLALRRRTAIAQEYLAAINSILDVIKIRVAAGATSHLDMAREEAQIAAIEAQLPLLDMAEKQSLVTLAVLLGRAPEGFDVEARDLVGVTMPAVRPGLPSELLLRRPDIALAEAKLAAAHANVDAARAAFFPQIALTGSGGFVSTALGGLHGSHSGFNYGADLLQTIFDGGRLVGEKNFAEGVQKEYVAQYQSTVLHAYADVENALMQVVNRRRAEEHLRREVDAAHKAFQISELQYRQGVADLLAVLQAQQTLFSAQDQHAQAILFNRLATVSLYGALGGGWIENSEERRQFAQGETLNH